MRVYESKDIRNVGVVGHGDFPARRRSPLELLSSPPEVPTASSASMKATPLPILTRRKSRAKSPPAISTATAVAEWKKIKINILDTPGYNIFINDTRAALVAVEAALVVVDGVAGVEVQTEKVWGFAEDFKLPRAIVINKLDRERSDFQRALDSVQEVFGRAAVPIQIPIGSEREFTGVVDLIRMKSYTFSSDGDGKGKEGEIPEHLAEAAKAAHEALVEMVAEVDDKLLEEFFAEGTLPVEHIADGLRQAVRDSRIYPVMCASALHNVGAGLIADFIVENFPSPADREPVTASVNGAEGKAQDHR